MWVHLSTESQREAFEIRRSHKDHWVLCTESHIIKSVENVMTAKYSIKKINYSLAEL